MAFGFWTHLLEFLKSEHSKTEPLFVRLSKPNDFTTELELKAPNSERSDFGHPLYYVPTYFFLNSNNTGSNESI